MITNNVGIFSPFVYGPTFDYLRLPSTTVSNNKPLAAIRLKFKLRSFFEDKLKHIADDKRENTDNCDDCCYSAANGGFWSRCPSPSECVAASI